MKTTSKKTATKKQFITVEEARKAGNNGQNQTIKGDFVGKHVYCNVNSLAEYVAVSLENSTKLKALNAELLEALKEARACMVTFEESSAWDEKDSERLDKVNAAIQKAEGAK